MKVLISLIVTTIFLVSGIVILLNIGNSSEGGSTSSLENNVSMVDGKQIIQLQAKGGYKPRYNIAKAGVPTILRIDTNGTFDCSSALRIASMNVNKMLPQSGTTDIDLGVPQMGILEGNCSMGMFPFEIDFKG